MQGKHVRSTPDKNAFSKAVDGTNMTCTVGPLVIRSNTCRIVPEPITFAPSHSKVVPSQSIACAHHVRFIGYIHGWPGGGMWERFDFSCMDLRGSSMWEQKKIVLRAHSRTETIS